MTPLLLTAALLQPAPIMDAFGDPLPPGALCRIGTQQLRPGGAVTSLTFTPDGKRLVTGNSTSGVHVWDVASGQALQTVACPWHEMRAVSISADATRAILVSDTQGEVVDIASGKVLGDLSGFKACRDAWLSADGKRLAVWHASRLSLGRVGDKDFTGTVFGTSKGWRHFSVAFAPDGKTVVVAMSGIALSRHDAAGNHLADFSAPEEAGLDYPSCVLSGDGKVLAAARGFERRIDLFDVATGKHLRTLGEPGGLPALCLAFTADNRFLLAPTGRGVTIWDVASGKALRTLAGHNGTITAVAISPDGRTVATAGGDFTVRLWDFATGKPLHAFADLPGQAPEVRFTPDGKALVCTTFFRAWRDTDHLGPQFRLHDPATGQLLRRVDCDRGKLNDAVLSADGRVLALIHEYKQVEVRAAATWKTLLTFKPPADWRANGVELSPDGSRLVVYGHLDNRDGPDQLLTQIWDVPAGKPLLDLRGAHHDSRYFSDDGRTLYVRHRAGRTPWLDAYDTGTGKRLPRAAASPPPPDLASLAWHDRWLASSDYGSDTVAVRDLATGSVVRKFAVADQRFNNLAFSPTGRYLAVTTDQGRILVWDLADGRLAADLVGHRGVVCSLAWSPDGQRLASGATDTTILVWDATTWPAAPALACTAAQEAALWDELASPDAARGLAAAGKLARSPRGAALLRTRLRPATAADTAALHALVADLGSDKFPVRQGAQRELEESGELAAPALMVALGGKPPLEQRRRIEILLAKLEAGPPAPRCAQLLRALQALEWSGTPAARALLEELAAGADGAWLTIEARRSLQHIP